MKSTHEWYGTEMSICLHQLLDENYDPSEFARGWLERGDYCLDIINSFINSAMMIGYNPLTGLRKQFPFLNWRYVNYYSALKNESDRQGCNIQICKDISYCDFFWFAIDTQGWHLVLATRNKIPEGTEPKSLFGSACSIDSVDEFDDSMADRKYLERYLLTKSLREQTRR